MMAAFDPERRLFALLKALALTTMIASLSACGSTDGGQGEEHEERGSPNTPQQQGVQPPADGGQEAEAAGGGDAGSKIYRVGDADEVELRAQNGRPVLVVARPNAGWSANVSREGNEVKVRFRRGEAEWEFEAEPEHGGIEVKSEPR